MWVDMSGEQVVREHKTGVTCIMKYFPYSYWSKDYQRKVMGVVLDARNKPRYMLSGHWDDGVEVCQVIAPDVPALADCSLSAASSPASGSASTGANGGSASTASSSGRSRRKPAAASGGNEDGEQSDEDEESNGASAPSSQNGNVSFSAAQRVFQSSLKTGPPRISWKLKKPPYVISPHSNFSRCTSEECVLNRGSHSKRSKREKFFSLCEFSNFCVTIRK